MGTEEYFEYTNLRRKKKARLSNLMWAKETTTHNSGSYNPRSSLL